MYSWEKNMCLTIVEGPESLTKEFEIDMMGTRKSLKVTEALLFSFSQSTFYLNSIRVFFTQKRKIEIQNSIGPKRTLDKRPVPEEVNQTKACGCWADCVNCFTNLSEEIARSKWPSSYLSLCAACLSEVCVKLFVLWILPREMKYFY